MKSQGNLYDELPYKSAPIEWTAPERLVLASLLHGGPRLPPASYSVLELGCGNGANLLPLAYYRRHAAFVGVDGAESQIKVALERKLALDLPNIEFIHADFLTAGQQLSGQFDYIIAHGVFSWVPEDVRDALLAVFAERLRPGGLLYLNYNTLPGWSVRGLVREFLIAQTDLKVSLRARAEYAKEIAAKVVAALTGVEHPYSQLLTKEFRFVQEGDVTWVGHEFLATDNHPYWRSEFLALAIRHGLEYVADADFNYPSGRIPQDLVPRLEVEQITGRCLEDTVDLLCYRQLHSPILTPRPFHRRLPGCAEFANLWVASCLESCPAGDGTSNRMFKHPSGYEVEAKEDFMHRALIQLRPLWPRGLRVAEAFTNVGQIEEDLRLLQRNGLLELRCIEPGDFEVPSDTLNNLERGWGGYLTTPYHQTHRILD
jgi:SAM-dependent methyltransferase